MFSIGAGDQGVPVRIRPARPGDFQNVLQLASTEFDYIANPEQFFKNRMEKYYFFVAEMNGEFAGFIDMEAEDERTARIAGIAVAPQFRGRGVGSVLMGFGIRFLRAMGFRSVVLMSREENTAANALYRKFGFVPYHRAEGIVYWVRTLD